MGNAYAELSLFMEEIYSLVAACNALGSYVPARSNLCTVLKLQVWYTMMMLYHYFKKK